MYITDPGAFNSITGDGSAVFDINNPTDEIALHKKVRQTTFSGATFDLINPALHLSWAVEII
jgi:hypothetical protein